METVREVTERIDHGRSVKIEAVIIAGVQHTLTISNFHGCVALDFSHPGKDNEFVMTIRDGKVFFSRTVYRPDHDHDNMATLQIMQNDTKALIGWYSRFPYAGENREFLGVEFGPFHASY